MSLALVPETVIEVGPAWTLAVNTNQDLLGKTMVVLNRPCEAVVDLSGQEWVALHQELRRVVAAMTSLFAPDQFNFSFLMNQDAQVHLHVLPRYAGPRRWRERLFEDPGWGGAPAPVQNHLPAASLALLAEELRASLAVPTAQAPGSQDTARVPVQARYDRVSAEYDTFVSQSFIHRLAVPTILELAQPPGGKVLDLGCGQGILARALAARGDRVTGVDISERLLDLARGYEDDNPLGIEYLHADAATLAELPDGTFNGVASCLTLTDLDDLDGVLSSVARVLRPGGWFVLAGLHPCFEPPHARVTEVDGRAAKQANGYFEEGWWRSKNADSLLVWRHHRRLATIINSLVAAGFRVDQVREPQGAGTLLDVAPIYGEVAEVLAIRAMASPS